MGLRFRISVKDGVVTDENCLDCEGCELPACCVEVVNEMMENLEGSELADDLLRESPYLVTLPFNVVGRSLSQVVKFVGRYVVNLGRRELKEELEEMREEEPTVLTAFDVMALDKIGRLADFHVKSHGDSAGCAGKFWKGVTRDISNMKHARKPSRKVEE